jgi:hypothetical protein
MPVRPVGRCQRPWNKGLLIGQKKPLEPKRSIISRRVRHRCWPKRAFAPTRPPRNRYGHRSFRRPSPRISAKNLQQTNPDEAARPAGRADHGLRRAGRSAFELPIRRDHRRYRRQALPVDARRLERSECWNAASPSSRTPPYSTLVTSLGSHPAHPGRLVEPGRHIRRRRLRVRP